MRVLVGCEYSGVVRDAFIKSGHEAMSCDLLPTESPGPHYEGDIFDVIDYPWDLAIFHPPCTHTAVSGARYFEAKRMDGRQQAAVSFFMRLVRRSSHIPRRAFEQPISIISRLYRKPDQIIQPWQFGHDESKSICLWLKNLPPLLPTQYVEGRVVGTNKRGKPIMRWANQTDSGQNRLGPSEDRWKIRSKFFPGIAEAMSQQWSRA